MRTVTNALKTVTSYLSDIGWVRDRWRAPVAVLFGTLAGLLVTVVLVPVLNVALGWTLGLIWTVTCNLGSAYVSCAAYGAVLSSVCVVCVQLGRRGNNGESRLLPRSVIIRMLLCAGLASLVSGIAASYVAQAVGKEYYEVRDAMSYFTGSLGESLGARPEAGQLLNVFARPYDELVEAARTNALRTMPGDGALWGGVLGIGAAALGLILVWSKPSPLTAGNLPLGVGAVVSALLVSYCAVEWFTGGRGVAIWILLAGVISVPWWLTSGKLPLLTYLWKAVRTCGAIGLGMDLLWGDESLVWKLAIAVGLSIAAIVASSILEPMSPPEKRKADQPAAPPPVPIAPPPDPSGLHERDLGHSSDADVVVS